ncbi:MAG: hypothetical protein QOI61_614 [Actinomycetota bacterium]|jgi:hypothetical protein
MKKRLVICCAAFGALLVMAAPASALKVADPTPNAAFSDAEGNQGYVDVAPDDAAVLRACNENDATPAGDKATGYIWVNPNGEATTPTYGNATVGAGDADGEEGTVASDGDLDTSDDCAGNTDAE